MHNEHEIHVEGRKGGVEGRKKESKGKTVSKKVKKKGEKGKNTERITTLGRRK